MTPCFMSKGTEAREAQVSIEATFPRPSSREGFPEEVALELGIEG